MNMAQVLFDAEKAARWLDEKTGARRIFYSSVDLRRGAGRICPVDVNVFPAGFNNLCKTDAAGVAPLFRDALSSAGALPGSSVGVIAESHTRNPYYAEHLHALIGFLRNAGYRAEASCPECADDVTVRSASGQSLNLLPIVRRGDTIVFGSDFVPDMLLLNNDLAGGIPFLLKNISQTLLPPPQYGWFSRRKHSFFEVYARMAEEFGIDLGIDPRMISPLSLRVPDVDFKQKSGLDRIAAAVETVLEASRKWNQAHARPEPPVAIVKSNYGTYGMAVMSVHGPDEILNINRKTMNKMHIGKGKVQTTEVLVQEGIPTEDTVDGCPAEPVVYLIGGELAGAFYRLHCERDNQYNLNVSGMSFKPICLHDLTPGDSLHQSLVIGRLACAAAARELLSA